MVPYAFVKSLQSRVASINGLEAAAIHIAISSGRDVAIAPDIRHAVL